MAVACPKPRHRGTLCRGHRPLQRPLGRPVLPAPHPPVERDVEVERLPQPCHHHQPAAAVRRELLQRRPWAEGPHHRLRSHRPTVVQLRSEPQRRPSGPVGARAVGCAEEQLYQASDNPLRVRQPIPPVEPAVVQLIPEEELSHRAPAILVHVPVHNDRTGWEGRSEVGCDGGAGHRRGLLRKQAQQQ